MGMDVEAPLRRSGCEDEARDEAQDATRNELLQAADGPAHAHRRDGRRHGPSRWCSRAWRAGPRPRLDEPGAGHHRGGRDERRRRQLRPPAPHARRAAARGRAQLPGGARGRQEPRSRRCSSTASAAQKGLAGHAVGNLLIAALAELKGDFLEAVRCPGSCWARRARCCRSTLAPVQLVAQMDDDTEVVGERNICRAHGRVRRVSLSPRSPPPVDGLHRGHPHRGPHRHRAGLALLERACRTCWWTAWPRRCARRGR